VAWRAQRRVDFLQFGEGVLTGNTWEMYWRSRSPGDWEANPRAVMLTSTIRPL
jgi:hypothetical protein